MKLKRFWIPRPRERQIDLLVTGSHFHVEQARATTFSGPSWKTHTADLSQLQRGAGDFDQLLAVLERCNGWYHIGGHTLPQIHSLDLIRESKQRHVPIIIHWFGTDILTMTEKFSKSPEVHQASWQVTHWVAAPWFVDQLAALGLDSTYMPYSSERHAEFLLMEPPALPARFSILSYVPDGHEELYGWEYLVRLANDFPENEISIISGTGKSVRDVPANIHFLGWLEHIYPAYRESSLLVRMIKHDGYARTVQEMLLLGRYVIWNYGFPGAILAQDYQTLQGHVKRLLLLHDQGALQINLEGRHHIKRNLNPAKLAENVRNRMKKIVTQSRMTRSGSEDNS